MAVACDRRIEGFDWEVSWGAILNFCDRDTADHRFVLDGVGEVVLLMLSSMVAGYIEVVIRDKCASDDGLPESSNWFGVIIESELRRHIQVIELLASVVDNRHEELSVVLSCDGKDVSSSVLFNQVHLKILSFVFFDPHLREGDEAVSLQLEVLVFVVDDGDRKLGVVGDDDRHDVNAGVDKCALGQILEQLTVLSKLFEAVDLSLLRCGLD